MIGNAQKKCHLYLWKRYAFSVFFVRSAELERPPHAVALVISDLVENDDGVELIACTPPAEVFLEDTLLSFHPLKSIGAEPSLGLQRYFLSTESQCLFSVP